MVLSLFSVLVGIINIASQSQGSKFEEVKDFFSAPGKAGIARIELYGSIEDGYGSAGTIGADKIVGILRDAKESEQIKAVILAINSPGGTVGGTKKIYDAVIDLKKTKPVVSIVSDIAASGGYYIASASDRILAYEGSIVGSIGVISYSPDVSGFMNQHGLKMGVVKSGAYKDIMSPFRPMTDTEKSLIQSMIDDAHQQFIADVAIGRNQPITAVRQWADGRVFSGKAARAEQIIDDFGGEEQARTTLKLLLKTTEELPIFYPERTWIDDVIDSMGRDPMQFKSHAGIFSSYGSKAAPEMSDSCTSLTSPGGLHYIYPGSSMHMLRILRCGGQM